MDLNTVQLMVVKQMLKTCCKCKLSQSINEFGNLKSSPDGLRYDCKSCRKSYCEQNKESIRKKQQQYYSDNKSELIVKNKEYRNMNIDKINEQRKQYRAREDVKKHIKNKNKEYLPVRKEKIKQRRQNDNDFRIKEVLRSKIHKFLKNQKTSYTNMLGCDLEFFKKWIEYRFSPEMSWNNFGDVWEIDHILPMSLFKMDSDDKLVCFHWTNLQPLNKFENKSKSNNIVLHHYFNNIVNVFRFNKKYDRYLGHQVLNESLRWLRTQLKYGESAPYVDAHAS